MYSSIAKWQFSASFLHLRASEFFLCMTHGWGAQTMHFYTWGAEAMVHQKQNETNQTPMVRQKATSQPAMGKWSNSLMYRNQKMRFQKELAAQKAHPKTAFSDETVASEGL